MKDKNTFDNNVIVRFLMAEASPRDVKLLESWISSDPVNKAYFEQIRDTWNSIELEKELDEQQVQDDLEHVLNRIDPPPNKQVKNNQLKGKSPLNWFLKSAAIFILGFAVSWILYKNKEIDLLNENVLQIIETPKGSSTKISLPDGSKIWLNAGSKITYSSIFNKNSREVFLEEEAFFSVSKDEKRQFIVKTPDITVKVFGTSFNVKSYPNENAVETTLVEGSISLYKNSTNGKASGEEIKLDPSQRVVLYKEEQETRTLTESTPKRIANVPERKPKLVLSKHIDTEMFTSWKDGHLIIKSEPLEELALTLERKYNVSIHFIDEEIRQFRFTGTFENETIEQVLAAIKLASSIDYKIEEREIWINQAE